MQSNSNKDIAKSIIKKIQDEGFEAYFAGGYVRDMLIGSEAKDIDIVTSAKPDEIEALFDKTYAIGKSFGVINVVVKDANFEIATFREESDYSDNRRPQKVSFTNAKTDALRRDFTINGLFYDPIKNKVIDYIGGIEDIKKRTIRFIGNPTKRIEEDHLRLIRAIRFKSTLNFQYDQPSFKAIRKYSSLIKSVSKERIKDELNKIITCPNRHTALIELSESKLLKYIIPEAEEMKSVPQPEEYHQEGDVFTHTYLALKALPDNSDLRLCWAVLLHDIGKPPTLIKEGGRIIFHNHAQKSAEISDEILRRLKFSKVDRGAIVFLVENHMKIAQLDNMRPGKRERLLTHPLIDDLIKLAEADQRGKIPTELDFIEKIKREVKKVRIRKEHSIRENKEKIFSGDTLVEMGFMPGPKIKEIIEDIEDLIAEGKLKDKENIKKYIKEKYAKNK
jgi:poly(A) polymerase